MAETTTPNRRTVLYEKGLEEWNEKYEQPSVEGRIVGFTGISPDRKQSEGGGGEGSGLTEAQVRAIAREEAAAPCDCPEMATETEFDEMLRVVGLL